MGTTESKSNHRHRSTAKHFRYKNEIPIVHKCYRENKQPLDVAKKNSLKRKNETIVPLITSSPLNPNLHGSILNHSFPMQRSRSDIHISPYESSHDGTIENLDRYDHPKGLDDYQKEMQRVDEENRPVLEGLCPDKMYVSTNDLQICDTQRLPPPVRCKMIQGFFRPIPPPQFHKRKSPINASFL